MNMLKMDVNTFIETWEAFSSYFTLTNTDWLHLYSNNTEWSKRFLGGKNSCSQTSPIGNYFQKKFPALRYRREDGSFDLAFSFASNYSKLGYIYHKDINYFEPNGFYPTTYDVILEIENDCRCAWQEMAKLTWVRSPLKVLITYNWHPYDTNAWIVENKMLVDTFSNIIHQSNSNFKDNTNTQYLLIVGNNSDNKLCWRYYNFDSNGQLKN